MTTDVDGKVYGRNLRLGKYTIKELATKPQYLLNEKVFDVTISEHKQVVKIDVKNEPVKGFVALYKIDFDDNNKLIQGAEFILCVHKECLKPLETLITDERLC